jgi:hypothetical protein
MVRRAQQSPEPVTLRAHIPHIPRDSFETHSLSLFSPQQRAWVLPAPTASAFHQAVYELKLARIERAAALRPSAKKGDTMQAVHVDLTQRIPSEAKSATASNGIGAGVLRPGPRPIFWSSKGECMSTPATVDPHFDDNPVRCPMDGRPAQ